MTQTVTIGTIEFVVVPEPAPVPKTQLKQTRRHVPTPQCTASRGVMCSDGINRMNYLAERFEREKNRGWLERWGIWVTFEE